MEYQANNCPTHRSQKGPKTCAFCSDTRAYDAFVERLEQDRK